MAANNSNKKSILVYIFIFIVGLVIAALVHMKSDADYVTAVDRYQKLSQKETEEAATSIGSQFTQIYQGLRTISMLPSVVNIDRQGKNLDGNARESIIQIYKNLRSNVVVSEVYVVPVGLEPEKIDPETGSLETPILMFDDEVAAHKEDKPAAEEAKITTIEQAEKAKEVEIYEYRTLKEQMGYLKVDFAKQAAGEEKMNIPFIGSAGVLTCDNGDFEKTNNMQIAKGWYYPCHFMAPPACLKERLPQCCVIMSCATCCPHEMRCC